MVQWYRHCRQQGSASGQCPMSSGIDTHVHIAPGFSLFLVLLAFYLLAIWPLAAIKGRRGGGGWGGGE
jgi:hypothetical protein